MVSLLVLVFPGENFLFYSLHPPNIMDVCDPADTENHLSSHRGADPKVKSVNMRKKILSLLLPAAQKTLRRSRRQKHRSAVNLQMELFNSALGRNITFVWPAYFILRGFIYIPAILNPFSLFHLHCFPVWKHYCADCYNLRS